MGPNGAFTHSKAPFDQTASALFAEIEVIADGLSDDLRLALAIQWVSEITDEACAFRLGLLKSLSGTVQAELARARHQRVYG
ncbi:hypothetical protein [Ruegeria sp. Ofav3-42]|uniref:hypothetical protein n=1 Tax=Ruegeria sp. Ofav3-42 TaxID=2917759 RepID=UPI001EF6974A|nr:hypothetical protein [Ruegeria sp. Ofav3-42]MCG7519745.1 hypothetical protein [Ruegeria sp. Ofav3-42]